MEDNWDEYYDSNEINVEVFTHPPHREEKEEVNVWYFLGPPLVLMGFAFVLCCALLTLKKCSACCVNWCCNPEKMAVEGVNKYMPGVVVRDDGTVEFHEPTPAELSAMADVVKALRK